MIALAAALLALAAPPLPEPVSQALASLPTDPPGTNNDTHYLVSNERRPDLFGDRLGRHPGGVYIGVGAEQNYVLAGWTQPELLVLLDFDPMVGDLHRVHLAFFLESATPDGYRALWAAPEVEQLAVLARWVPDGEPLARATRALTEGRGPVVAQLRALVRSPPGGRATYVTDPAQYTLVRDLAVAGRVIVVQGDLTGAHALSALARVLNDAQLVVRTVYLSNAEQYFMYDRRYRENIRALPVDSRTLILRTLPGRPRDFEYITQSGTAFQAWLASPRTRSVYAVRGLVRGDHLIGETAFHIRALPAAPRAKQPLPPERQ